MNRISKTMKIMGGIFAIVGAVLGCLEVVIGCMLGFAIEDFIIGGVFFAVFLLVGLILLIISCTSEKKVANRCEKLENLRQQGICLRTHIDKIEFLPTVKMNAGVGFRNPHPFRIVSSCVLPNGSRQVFTSGHLYYNPTNFLRQTDIPVYKDRNSDAYIIDTNILIPENAKWHKFTILAPGQRSGKTGSQCIAATIIGTDLLGQIAMQRIAPVTVAHFTPGNGLYSDVNTKYYGFSWTCRMDEPDGTVHIFYSNEQSGNIPVGAYGRQISIYFNGTDFKNAYSYMQ